MYLLDTNIISLLDSRRRQHAPALVPWIGRHAGIIYLSAMTIAELYVGLLRLRRRQQDRRADEISAFIDGVQSSFGDRVLPIDAQVARAVAELQDRILPAVIDLADLIIAATAKVHSHIILTNNSRHFEPTGVPVLDPLRQLPDNIR
jgi:predicted nucleic acid-binding protein